MNFMNDNSNLGNASESTSDFKCGKDGTSGI